LTKTPDQRYHTSKNERGGIEQTKSKKIAIISLYEYSKKQIMNQVHSVSVIIPCRNEEQYIERCIMSIINGTSKNIQLEILVVDGGSNDKTTEIVINISKEHKEVLLIQNEKKHTQFGLNLGIQSAINDWVLIAGAHTNYPPNYIEELLENSIILNADGVGGQLVTDVLHATPTSIAIKTVLSHPLGVGNSMFRIGVNKPTAVDTVPFGLYRKSLFSDVGYYNELLVRNHDIEWSKRVVAAGNKIYLLPNVVCTYFARETYSALARNNFRNGLWNMFAVYITKTFSSLSIRHFIPLCFVLVLILFAVASVFEPAFLFLLTGILLFYLFVLSVFTLRIRKSGISLFHVIWAFATLHFSYGFGSLVGLFRGIRYLFNSTK